MLNTRKSTRYNIPAKLLRMAHVELASPISKLINKARQMNVFQETMKCAELSPIYKKDDNLLKNNFRPVSVLTGMSNFYESVVNDQLLEFFCKLFNDLICAFRKGYSCQSLLMKCVDNWKIYLDKKQFVGLLFMDFSKAFDSLPHGLIIAKLHAYGVTTAAVNFYSLICMEGSNGQKLHHPEMTGQHYPKGYHKDPFWVRYCSKFFMNDLFIFIEKCNLYNYADDNSLDSSSENLSEVLINLKVDGRNAIDWLMKNGMRANPDKFHFMLISSTPIEKQMLDLYKDIYLESEAVTTVLVVTIYDQLNFSNHISACYSKAARQLNALARFAKYIDIRSRKTNYNSFILSNFNYCPLVWQFCGKINNDKLEKIQERTLRILYQDHNSL